MLRLGCVLLLGCPQRDEPGDAKDSAPVDTGDDTAACAEPQAWFRDADGDEYGDPSEFVGACEPPAGYVADNTDCDDADDAFHPNVPETACAGPDLNCNGRFDEGDADGDGVLSCDDCDDADARVFPAAEERYTSGEDDNCDGAFAATDIANVPSYRVVAKDTEGWTVRNLATTVDISSDVTGDGLVDFVLGGDVIRAADGVSLNVGALLVYPGPIYADAAEHTLGQAPAVLLGGLPGDFIDTVCAVGDVDGDGYEDLVASGTSGGDPPVGVAYLVRGPVVGTIDLAASAQRFDGEWFGAALGTCAGPGDLDGDGLNDIVLGSSGVSGGSSGHPGGQVYLLHGPVSETKASDTPDMLAGTDKLMEYLGYSVAVLGDLSGDGLLDYGVTNWGGPAPDGVAAYLVTELPDGVAHPRDVGVTVQYDKSGLGFLNNMIINKVGDITGDGYDDVGFGASDGPQSNLIATLSGPFGGDALLDLTTEWDTLLLSDAIDSYASFAAGLGDWNGDGHEDLAVGDPHFATKARMRTGACDANPADCYMGAVFLLAGPIAAGSIDLHADADRLEGTYSTGELGRALGGGGDINGDGFPDLAVGAPHGNDGTHEGTGIGYVLFGGGSP